MRTNKLYAVIHTIHPDQALVNAVIAKENGADGVFLIDHAGREFFHLVNAYKIVREEFPDWWIGLNFLNVRPSTSVDLLPRGAQALWLDDIGYIERTGQSPDIVDEPMKMRTKAKKVAPDCLIFGGVDFKGQMPALDLGRASRAVAAFVDVVTTSGSATGKAPPIEKIRLMREAIPNAEIAVASGLTPDNVQPFLDHADRLLVSTGISKNFHYLDPRKVRAMARRMRR